MTAKKKGSAKHLLRAKKADTQTADATTAEINQVIPHDEIEPTRRVHLSYAGQVNTGQFVYAATENAERLGLTGWIQRAYHGVADLVVQGPASKVSSYERTMVENDNSGVLFSLADLEELKPVSNEVGFSTNDYMD